MDVLLFFWFQLSSILLLLCKSSLDDAAQNDVLFIYLFFCKGKNGFQNLPFLHPALTLKEGVNLIHSFQTPMVYFQILGTSFPTRSGGSASYYAQLFCLEE